MTRRRRWYRPIMATGALLLMASCTSLGAADNKPAASAHAINATAIPLGDGHVSTSPKVGYVDSCQSFSPTGPGHVGPWINTTKKTWNANAKIHVRGSVSWPSASYKVTVSGGRRVIKTNGLPINHTTGTFPIATSDPAYAYDRNPNAIQATSVTWSLPQNPKKAAKATCTSLGAIGILSDGVLLFNALDRDGHDGVAREVLDNCDGHPMGRGTLHHHNAPSCILAKAKGTSTLIGYATDGFGIYVERSSNGQLLTNGNLDACHGRVSKVLWNGKTQSIFHYVATTEYPYTIGCFEGTKTATNAVVF